MFDAETGARLDAIGKLGFTNPFGADRPRLEARIVGKEAARPSLWSRSADWPLDDPVIQAIWDEAEKELERAHSRIEQGVQYDGRARELIRGLVLYVLYYRYDGALYDWITAAAPGVDVGFYDAFVRDFDALFRHVGPPDWATNSADLLALFFQTRRAFHFVFHQILGTSNAAAKLRENVWESLFTHDPWRYLRQLRGRMHESSTLILGPSGTGKELVASAIGLSSFIAFDGRTRRFARDYRTAFHPIHLAAMSKTLLESELFGHKKGAFTGAYADRMGHFEGRSASETLFLDEIGELDPEVQVKLLRVLQARTFHRLGDTEPRSFGGKVVAATNRDLAAEMSAGSFRADLYYRLCSDVIRAPSLQEQVAGSPDELSHLVQVLTQRTLGAGDSDASNEVMAAIERGVGFDYSWPGNMRELEQCVRNVLIHGRYDGAGVAPTADALQPVLDEMRAGAATLSEVSAGYARHVYTRTGSFSATGKTLGIDRRTAAKLVGDTFQPSEDRNSGI